MKTNSKKPKRPVRRKPSATPTQLLAPGSAVNTPVVEMVPSLLKIARSLVPLDLSDCSLKAPHYAVRFAEQFGAKLTLLHIVEAYPIDCMLGLKDARDSSAWMFDRARAQLDRLRATLGSARSTLADQQVAFGKTFHPICEAAKERNIDIIIIATHGRTGLQRLQLGSTVERVVRHAPCPVLGLVNQEGEILKKTVGPSLLYAVVAAIMAAIL